MYLILSFFLWGLDKWTQTGEKPGSGPTSLGPSCNPSRVTFPILSRDPSFKEAIKNPGETAGF